MKMRGSVEVVSTNVEDILRHSSTDVPRRQVRGYELRERERSTCLLMERVPSKATKDFIFPIR
jgi:hypothetical protein